MALYLGDKRVTAYLGSTKVRVFVSPSFRPINIDPTRYYRYVNTSNLWSPAGDSYSIVIPCKANTTYRITVPSQTPYNGKSNTIFRTGTTPLKADEFPSSAIPLKMAYWGTPQGKHEVIFTTDESAQSIIVQMSSGAFPFILANGDITCGEFVSGVVPSDYTQLDYLESTGAQYIDTGYKVDYEDEFECLCEMLSYYIGGQATGPHGARNSGSQVWGNYISYSGVNYTCWGNKVNITFSQNLVDGQFHFWNTNKIGFYLDGVQKTDLSGSEPTLSSNDNVCLFGRYDGSGVIQSDRFWIGRIKTYKHKKNGVLVRNMVPVKRNNDGAIGMFDTISGAFFELQTYAATMTLSNLEQDEIIGG